MSNTITAYFKGRVGVAESVYQNDYGIVMAFDSIDLPAHFDCYFSVPGSDTATAAVGADNRVAIPNSVLGNSGNMAVHIPLHTGSSDSEVEYVAYFKVIGRARPEDDGTPAQMTAIERALALLSQPITNIEEIVNEALSFTGDTFAEMKQELQDDFDNYTETLEGDLATWKGGVESDFDNLEAQFDTAVAAVTTDTEVTNIRVGDDNVTYTTAGEAVRTQFSNVKAEINYQLTEDTISGWEMGSFNGANGAKFSANTAIRNNVFFGATTGVIRLVLKTGYKALIFAWNTSNESYAGCLKTSGIFEASGTNMAFVKEFNCSKFPQYKFHVVITRDPEVSGIAPSEGANCILCCSTDKSLSLENKSADANIVGHAIDKGTYTLKAKSSWMRGFLSDDGTIKYEQDYPHRVCSVDLITVDIDTTLKASSGYEFYLRLYDNGSWTPIGWITEYSLTAGQQFKIMIKHVPENTGQAADIDLFSSSVSYNCFLYEKILEADKEIEKYARIESVEPHSKQFDLLGLYLKNGAFKTGRMLFPDNTAKIKFHFPNSEFSAQFELFEKDGDYEDSTLSSVYHDGDTMQLNGQYLTYVLTITPDASMTLAEFKNLVGFSVRITYESFDGSVVARNADCERYVKALMLTNNGTYYNYFNPVLVHVSDIHGDSQRLKNAYEYAKSLNAGLLINTGDTVFNTPTDGIGFAADYDDEFGIPTAVVVGNHDSLFRTEEARVYNEIIAFFATKWEYVANSKPYYYWDVDSINIRCIALNQFMNGVQSYSQDQIDMLCNALASTPENYGVLLLNHMPECYLGDLIDKQAPFNAVNGSWSMGDYKDIVPDIIDAFISKGSLSKSYANTGISVSVDFASINSGVEFIAHINGHTHRDCIGYYDTTNKQLVLNITCTNSGYGKPGTNELNDNSNLPRGDKGKVQDAFNVYSIDRVNGVVKVARIGSNLTTDFVEMDYVVANYRD